MKYLIWKHKNGRWIYWLLEFNKKPQDTENITGLEKAATRHHLLNATGRVVTMSTASAQYQDNAGELAQG